MTISVPRTGCVCMTFEFAGVREPLQEDTVGTFDLADVVQKGNGNQVRDIFRRDPQCFSQTTVRATR